MKSVQSFNDFIGEGRGNLSMYKSVVQDALHLLGYDLKQSEFKVSIKRESLYDLILLNGYSLCSSSDYAQMLTWIQNAIKEDPVAYGLDPDVLEESTNAFINEGRVYKTTSVEIVGKDAEDIEDAVAFLNRGMGYAALTKECNGKLPYAIFHHNNLGEVKNGLTHSQLDIHQIDSAPKISVDEFIDAMNKVLNDHGYDRLKIDILKESVNDKVDEAMVQIAGKSKPAGAMVLAKVITEFLEKEKHLTPAAERQLIGITGDIYQLIIDNTF
jgi:hypothetical protein